MDRPDLDDVIRYDVEHTGLDFKKAQYTSRKYLALLKDLLAMANAHVTGSRYIVVGVKVFPNGEREFHDIPASDFIDDAAYQELVFENIEPTLNFSYIPYGFEGHSLGVFVINPQESRPYMMKKKYDSLNQGDMFIRRGTQQGRVIRSDLDKMASSSSLIAPKLKLRHSIDSGARWGDGRVECRVHLGIENDGDYLARFPGMVLKGDIKILISPLSEGDNWVLRSSKRFSDGHLRSGLSWSGGYDDIIHPGSLEDVGYIRRIMSEDDIEKENGFTFNYELFAEGCEKESGSVLISANELLDALHL